MFKKALIFIIPLFLIIILAGVVVYKNNRNPKTLVEPIKKIEDALVDVIKKEPNSAFEKLTNEKENINVILLGIDRRSKQQTGFNTDIMILLSANPNTNRVLLTSVPRDLWVNGNKINALYTIGGWNLLKDAFEQITGQIVSGYIRCDFEDFKWIVDAFGGVPINVEKTFTDHTFPNDADTGILTVTFNQGLEKMDGQRALTFARSRKGNNGEGSDLMRAKRQHLLLQGMVQAISQPESIFWPMDMDKFYSAIIAVDKMYTTLTLEDVTYLWDFYKDREQYSVESFVVGNEYVYHPGMYPQSEYHAWVFIARESGFANLHADIKAKLEGTFTEKYVESAQSAPNQKPL